MSEWAAKRFWTAAKAVEAEGAYHVELDGRPIRTPSKQLLAVPSLALAQAIAKEWDAQTEKVDPETMPLTRLGNSALDKVQVQHSAVADVLAAYGDSDLLCYRADRPEELVARQSQAWDPLLTWAEDTLNVSLNVQVGLMPVDQPADSLERVKSFTHSFDAFELTAFHELVSLSGSWVIGMAAMRESVSAETLWNAVVVDEVFQAERWGDDDEALQMRAAKSAAFTCANRFLQLCRRR